jgi:hypothetical protein
MKKNEICTKPLKMAINAGSWKLEGFKNTEYMFSNIK